MPAARFSSHSRAENPVYALVVGADSYRDYAPDGASDLPGALQDARAWARWCHRSLGLRAEQVRVLTGPQADRAAMVAGLRWLAQQVAKEPGSSAFFAFSGHGLTVERDRATPYTQEGVALALAPADITPDLEQALLFAEIEAIVARAACEQLFGTAEPTPEQGPQVAAVLQNTTVVLDCCYAYTEVPGARSLTAAGTAKARAAAPHLHVFARQLLACQQWETAYEIQVHGRWHGAFSIALQTLLEQWRVGTDAHTDVHYVRAAYGELMYRTRELVQTLGVPGQRPTLLGRSPNLTLLPFLRPGDAVQKGSTSADPDGRRLGEEFSSENDTQFRLAFFNATLKQRATSNMYAQLDYDKNRTPVEIWSFFPEAVQGLGDGLPSTYEIDSEVAAPTKNVQTYSDTAGVQWAPAQANMAQSSSGGPTSWTKSPGGLDANGKRWAIQVCYDDAGYVSVFRTYSENPATTVDLVGAATMGDETSAIDQDWKDFSYDDMQTSGT